MKTLITAMAMVALLAGDAVVQSQPKQPGRVSRLMAEKLKNAKVLLEGIALADFAKVTRSAEELIQLTRTEEWLVIKTPRYEMHSNEFVRAAEGVIQKAKKKNIDGVTLSYFELTMSCVRCHSYVREVRDARLPAAETVAALRRSR
jgi:hypothetical protein